MAAIVSMVGLASVVLGTRGAGAAGGDGKAVFDQLCQGCHTIGGGKLAGPDLQGLADRRDRAWVEHFILNPDQVIASGDPIAKELVAEYGVPMPNLGVSQAQADALLSYLGFAKTAPSTTPSTPPEPAPAPATGNADRGHDLFRGTDRLDAGGPSCLSCHSVAGVGALGGGQLGPDLTGAFEKYGGEQGLQAALRTMPFPTMAPIFNRKPLTAAEQADLVAYLKTAPQATRAGGAAGKLIGLSAAALAVIGVIGAGIWRRRLPGVRRQLVNRSTGK